MNELTKPILVPWDFSEKAEYALLHAIDYSKMLSKEIGLVHIVKKASEIEPALEKLNKFAESIHAKYGIRPIPIVKEGSIFTEITDIIEETDATLAIMGTHGMKGLQKLTGSWALKVITGSKAPFVVVQEAPVETEIKNIVFPIDFKTEEKEKLIWANFLSQLFKCKFYLCYVESADPLVKKRTTGNIKVAVKYLEEKTINYELIKLDGKGSIASESIKFAQEVGSRLILIMTTKNIRFQDYVLGASEQQIIANEAKIPVMCVNPRADLHKFGGFGN